MIEALIASAAGGVGNAIAAVNESGVAFPPFLLVGNCHHRER